MIFQTFSAIWRPFSAIFECRDKNWLFHLFLCTQNQKSEFNGNSDC